MHGGEQSIEGFGEEATDSRRAALLGAFRAYLGALAVQRYRMACAYLSNEVRGSLSQLHLRGSGARSCPVALAHLLSPSAAAVAGSEANGKVERVRAQGDLGFVVFRALDGSLYQLPLVREGNRWKASVATASILVPSRASIEG